MTSGDEIDGLYGLPLDEFTQARNELARSLRKDGRREEAAEVAGLRKPTPPAWVVNQLVRERRSEVRHSSTALRRSRRAPRTAIRGSDEASTGSAAGHGRFSPSPAGSRRTRWSRTSGRRSAPSRPPHRRSSRPGGSARASRQRGSTPRRAAPPSRTKPARPRRVRPTMDRAAVDAARKALTPTPDEARELRRARGGRGARSQARPGCAGAPRRAWPRPSDASKSFAPRGLVEPRRRCARRACRVTRPRGRSSGIAGTAEPKVPVGEDTPLPDESIEDAVRRGRWSGTPFCRPRERRGDDLARRRSGRRARAARVVAGLAGAGAARTGRSGWRPGGLAFLLDDPNRSVELDDRLDVGLACPGETTKVVARERTASYSAAVTARARGSRAARTRRRRG